MRLTAYGLARSGFRATNRILNRFGLLLSKPESIHGSPAFSGATLWARRLHQMRPYFDLIVDVDGAVIESGVHWGYALLIEYTLSDRRIFGFDSFAGHSTMTAADLAGGQYRPLDASFAVTQHDVWTTLRLGTGESEKDLRARVELISGWIQQTMPAFRERAARDGIRVALVHADCDIYEPFKATIENMWPLLAPGGVIILGRLDNPELIGKSTAVHEFFETIDATKCELATRPVVDNGGRLVTQSHLCKTS